MRTMQVLTTKIKPPALRKDVFRRASLLAKLATSLHAKVTVIEGGAGSGKTTLYRTFMEEQKDLFFRWISLDEANNDLFSFWHYIFEVFKAEDEAESFSELIQLLPQKKEIKNILIAFINSLAQMEKTVLVLDDFHFIQEEDLLASWEFFIKHSPSSLHFVLLTRMQPNLYLGDLMTAGQYLEITHGELRFSLAETKLFCRQTLGLDLPQTTIEALHQAAEGWPGGLQLLALTSQGKAGPIPSLTPHIIQYLSNEVLAQLEEEEKDFLISISILAHFDSDLCYKLTGCSDPEKLLTSFLTRNLFLTVLDQKERIYRFHPLFAEFLVQQFAKRDWAEQKRLHLKAAKALEARGNIEASIGHSLAAEDYAYALKLIAANGPSLNYWGYLKRIPVTAVVQMEEMAFQRLFYHYCNLELEECTRLLSQLEPRAKGALKSLYRLFLYIVADEPFSLEKGENWLEELEELDWNLETKAMLYVTFPMLLSMVDQYEDALKCVAKAEQIDGQLKNPYIRYFILNFKSQILEPLGELVEAELIYEKMFALIQNNPAIGYLKSNAAIGIAGIYLAQMRLEEAEASLKEAESLLDSRLVHVERAVIYNRMELEILRGKWEQAIILMEKLKALTASDNFFYHSALVKYTLLLQEANIKLSSFPWEKMQSEQKWLRLEDRLVQARIALAEGKLASGLKTLDSVLDLAKEGSLKALLVEGLLLKAKTMNELNEAEAIRLVEEAVTISSPQNLFAPFVLEGGLLRQHFAKLTATKHLESSWLERLGELLGISHGQRTKTELTERELEVLQELCAGYSNREIGENLHISLATVKTHLINIYSKLQVANRVEAVGKALELGLFPEKP